MVVVIIDIISYGDNLQFYQYHLLLHLNYNGKVVKVHYINFSSSLKVVVEH